MIGVVASTGSILVTGSVTVTDTITAIPTDNLDNRKAIAVFNNSNNTVYVGGSTVTTTTGYPLQPFGSLPFDVSEGADVYGICDTGLTADVRFLEIDNG